MFRGPLGLFGLAALLGVVACKGDKRGGSVGDDPFAFTGSGVDGGTGGTASGRDAAATSSSADGGEVPGEGSTASPDAGGVYTGYCGDGIVGGNETCDQAAPASRSCRLLGFDVGELSCADDCTWIAAACSGVESCYDGRDNDGDDLADCADADDCAQQCADACYAPPVLLENTSVSGSLLGHPAVMAASCGDAAPSGSEVVYRVDIQETAKFDVTLSTPDALTVSVRSDCLGTGVEYACGGATRLTLDATEGETYFVVVDGASAQPGGTYGLELSSRQQACGDGVRDQSEQCDDANINDGDGCDPDCFVESSETEPNDSPGTADTFDFEPWVAQIAPAADVDYYKVSLVATSSTLVVNTLNLGDGACGLNLMDTIVSIYAAGEGQPLVTDDNAGDGSCARAVATSLPPGDYIVGVAAAAAAQPSTFPYRLAVSVGVCGNGALTLGEECDDNNLVGGDGCSPTCQREQ